MITDKKNAISSLFIAAIILATVFFLSKNYFRVYVVKGSSMEDTIEEGDKVLVFISSNSPEEYSKDDIIVLEKDLGEGFFVKRLVATKGDTLLINNERILIDGKNIPHDPIFYSTIDSDSEKNAPCNIYTEILNQNLSHAKINKAKQLNKNECFVRVPDDYSFVVGDNYYQSMDSRFWGFIHKDQIIGEVIFRF